MKKDAMVVVMLPTQVKERARRKAHADGVTLSEVVRRAIEEYTGDKPSMTRDARGVTIYVPLNLDRTKPTAKRKAS